MSKDSNKKFNDAEVTANSSTVINDDLKAGKNIEVLPGDEMPCKPDDEMPSKKEYTQAEIQVAAQKSGTLINILLEMLRSTEKVVLAGDGKNKEMLAEVSTFRNEFRESLVSDLFEEYTKLKTVLT